MEWKLQDKLLSLPPASATVQIIATPTLGVNIPACLAWSKAWHQNHEPHVRVSIIWSWSPSLSVKHTPLQPGRWPLSSSHSRACPSLQVCAHAAPPLPPPHTEKACSAPWCLPTLHISCWTPDADGPFLSILEHLHPSISWNSTSLRINLRFGFVVVVAAAVLTEHLIMTCVWDSSCQLELEVF